MSPIKKLLSKDFNILSWINKYTLVILLFGIWISFFDRYSLVTQLKLSDTVEELEDEKKNYEKQLEEALKMREEINNNQEKYAREQYLFHKEGETIILIEELENLDKEKK